MNWEDVPALLDRLADLWPGYRPRPGQSQMARAVAHAVDSGLNLLVEGGTGVGKSIAYLLPAALAALEDDKRTLIATSHKQLQDQLSKQDLPRVDTLVRDLGYPGLAWTTLKGIGNYVCLVAADAERDAPQPHPLLLPVLEWLRAGGHYGEFDELPFPIPGDLRARLSTEAEECPHKRCPRFHECFAMAAWHRAEIAPIVITNHALLALHAASENHLVPGRFETIVIDEAHAFEDAATRAYGFECSSLALRRLLHHNETVWRQADRKLMHDARDALDRLDREVGRLLGQEATLLKDTLFAGLELADLLDELAANLDPEKRVGLGSYPYEQSPFDLEEKVLDGLSEEETALGRASKRAAALAERLRTISHVDDRLLVYYVEQIGPESEHVPGGAHTPPYTLLALPIDVGPFLEAWWEQQATVLTSATLSDGHSFRFVAERLGLLAAPPRRLIVPSPFDYPGRTRLVLTPVAGQDRPDPAYFARLADQIARLLDAAGGKCLLLFTSHRALDAVWAQLQVMRIAGWRLYRQGEVTQAQLRDTFTRAAPDARCAVFASRSWWQGVDLPGLRLIVMDKLPFPQLGDPLVSARSEQIEEVEGHAFQQYMLPLALIAFRQGFGRLMRTERDFGAVAVCDARLVQRSYGARFLEALPEDIPVLYGADDLRAWVRTMEAAEGIESAL